MATMFEKYGGFAAVSRIVSAFYDQVLDVPELAKYFKGTDMRRLIDHQTKFIASVMGGPASYSAEQLERVHANMAITERTISPWPGSFARRSRISTSTKATFRPFAATCWT